MASTNRVEGAQRSAGKVRSPSNGKWLKRALGAAQIRDRSKMVASVALLNRRARMSLAMSTKEENDRPGGTSLARAWPELGPSWARAWNGHRHDMAERPRAAFDEESPARTSKLRAGDSVPGRKRLQLSEPMRTQPSHQMICSRCHGRPRAEARPISDGRPRRQTEDHAGHTEGIHRIGSRRRNGACRRQIAATQLGVRSDNTNRRGWARPPFPATESQATSGPC